MVIRGPDRVHRVFTLTGLNEKLSIFDVAGRESEPLRARGRMNTTEVGSGRVDHTGGPGTQTTNPRSGSTGSRLWTVPQLSPETDGEDR
jgi:hypothetical protein